MFKQTILAALAFSMLAVPMAQAQQRHDGPRSGHHFNQQRPPVAQVPQRPQAHRPPVRRHQAQRPAPRPQWTRGHRVPNWQRRAAVRDYHRHGLRRPGHGQQWVRVDNNYLLISLASGIIAAIATAR